MTRKQSLLELLAYFQEQISAVEGILPPELLQASGKEDDWSAKDNLFHAVYWAGSRLEMLETISRGEPWEEADHGDFTEVNREIFERFRDRSWTDLQGMIAETYRGGKRFLEQHSEEALAEKTPGDERPVWRVMADNFLNHPMIHIWQLLQSSGLTERISEMFGSRYAGMLRGLDQGEGWLSTIDYNQACLLVLSGKYQDALPLLERAFRASPQLKEWSREDTDLDPLRNLDEFQKLVQ